MYTYPLIINYNKRKVYDIFELYLTMKTTELAPLREPLLGLSLSERLLLADIVLTHEMLRYNYCKDKFVFDECFQETADASQNVFVLLERYGSFFAEMQTDISDIIYDKRRFKTDFSLRFGPIDDIIYFSTLVRSIYFVDDIRDESSVDEEANMLHRNVVMANMAGYTQVFSLIGGGSKIKSNCIKLMMLLDKQVIKKKVKFTVKRAKSGPEFKTEVYIKFNIVEPFSYRDKINISYGRKPFFHLRGFLLCASHLTLCSVIKKCNYQWNPNTIDLEAVKTLSARSITIDPKYWPSIYLKLEEGFCSKYNISGDNFDSEISVARIIEQLQRVSLGGSDSRDITVHKGEDADIVGVADNGGSRKLGERNASTESGGGADEASKDIQRLRYASLIERIVKLNFPLYTAHYYDFRGRIYPKSPIGFMYLKLIRSCFCMGSGESGLSSLTSSKYYKAIVAATINIDARIAGHSLAEVDTYFLRVLLLELGKLRKKDFYAGRASLEELISKGAEVLVGEDTSWLDIDDVGYYLSVKSCISNFKTKGRWENITIIRDSTASSFQHWGSALGVRPGYTGLLNLTGEFWCDTYTAIIDMFLAKFPQYRDDPRLKNLLNRKNLKRPIMIVNYNAGRTRCLASFISALKDSGAYVGEDAPLYSEFMGRFHKFLSDDLFNEVYIKDKRDFLAQHSERLVFPDAEIHLSYQETTDMKEVTKVNGDRWVFVKKLLRFDVCQHKTNIALNANIIQAYDAELARFLVVRCNVWPVHDSFATGLFELHVLQDEVCAYFSARMGFSCDSMFILI